MASEQNRSARPPRLVQPMAQTGAEPETLPLEPQRAGEKTLPPEPKGGEGKGDRRQKAPVTFSQETLPAGKPPGPSAGAKVRYFGDYELLEEIARGGMGVVSEVIPCFARKNVFGYHFIALASVAIAVFGFLVWGHHMFVAGQSVYAAMTFSILSYLVAVPSAIKVFNWTATLYKGSIAFDTPMLFALGFIAMFTVGGLTGLFLAALGLDVHVHDTYFVIAHFHFIMVGGMVTGFMSALHYWWPKMSGRMYPETLGRVAALTIFFGFILTFAPQFILGYEGMPRRYYHYAPEFQVLNVMSSAGASILGVGYVLPLIYLVWSLIYGKPAGPNPWGATGLEWQTPSPPPTDNFEVTPVVTGEPYDYSREEVQGGR